MKFFKPWTWFQSEERALKLEHYRLQLEKERLQIEMLRKSLGGNTQYPPNQVVVFEEPSDKNIPQNPSFDIGEIQRPPYKSLRLLGSTVVVTLEDGEVLQKDDVDRSFYDSIKNCTSEAELITMFFPVKYTPETKEKEVVIETEEEREMVTSLTYILEGHPEFVISNNKEVFLKDVELELPASVLGSFIEIVEKTSMAAMERQDIKPLYEAFEALKMFWYWTALNPIESSRRDLLSFVKNHDINITRNGLLEMYRKIVKKSGTDKTLIEFISNSYDKVKKAKKGVSNYLICKYLDTYVLVESYKLEKYPDYTEVGNLKDMFDDLPNMEDNRYTDNHTRSKDIRIGQVYREDEDKIDLDNRADCSRGLHVGSHEFGFGGFGDTGVLALVNPAKVRSVPVSDTNKMRVSEMFIAAAMEIDDYKQRVLDPKVSDYSQEYFNMSVTELKDAIKNKTFDETYNCQDNRVVIANLTSIRDLLDSKVVEF